MQKFVITAIVFETMLIVVHIIVIPFLAKSCKLCTEKIANEDQSSIQVKQCNLKWKCIEIFTYSIIVETIICMIKSNGYYTNFMFLGILFLLPVYILTIIVIMIIYYIKKRKIKIQV